MAEGFLNRWSQRKQAVRQGKTVAVESLNSQGSLLPLTPSPLGGEGGGEGFATAPEPAQAPVPSLEDVQRLTAESDFKPFVARSVAPEVRNAAMKKLFTDPHYNVMDRLDIYIDDYSKPDPLPESMLRQMVGAKFLKLFEDEKTPKPDINPAIEKPLLKKAPTGMDPDPP